MRQRTSRLTLVVCLCLLFQNAGTAISNHSDNSQVQPRAVFANPSQVKVSGLLGNAIAASEQGRIIALPKWNDGELIKIFSEASRSDHDKTDWYGEHAGKWLCATAEAAKRTGDKGIEALLLKTADYLVSTQEQDGYLGTYSPKVRLTNSEAPHTRSWDVWNLSYMTLGLLETNKYFPNTAYLDAAKKLGELFLQTFGDGTRNITDYGTRHGVSATIVLEPVIELYKATGDQRYLNYAELVIQQMEENEGIRLITVAINGGDMENVGDGKAYQLLWNLTALTKLYAVTGKEEYFKAATNAWQNIHDHHLTITGGPWGGIGKHLECFNRRYFWSPYGFVETCSTMAWIQFNKELFRLTGEAKYAQEIETSVYNSLLGAQYPDGVKWCYHSFDNGRKHAAHFNDCCPSSGMLALSELSAILYSKMQNGISVNLFTSGEVTLKLNSGNMVQVNQVTNYPFDGKVKLTISPTKSENFPLYVRIPEWASSVNIKINNKVFDAKPEAGKFCKMERIWKKNDKVEIQFPMELKVATRTDRTGAPQGGSELYSVNWFALTRGPLVYASNGLIGGTDREHAIQVNADRPEESFSKVEAPEGVKGPAYSLQSDDNSILLLPYYEAGGRTPGVWRLTWFQSSVN